MGVGEGDVDIRWWASPKRGRRESNDVSVGAKHWFYTGAICSVIWRLSCAKLLNYLRQYPRHNAVGLRRLQG
jgi:hypothetical protein